MIILGIRYGHSASAAIVINGEIVANVMEERFTRVKNDGSFPEMAIRFCLDQAGVSSEDLDVIAFPSHYLPKPAYAFFKAKTYTIQQHIPGSDIKISEIDEDAVLQLNIPKLPTYISPWIVKSSCEFWCIDHHLSHASSAYYTSGIQDETLTFVLDGRGDGVSTSIWKGKNGSLEQLRAWNGNSSLGWFYSVVTEAMGWRHGSDEWKVMGLAPYGEPSIGILKGFHPTFRNGELEQEYAFGEADRWPDHGTNHYHFDAASLIEPLVEQKGRENIAAEAQRIVEQQLFEIVIPWIDKMEINKCCFAGGLFLNVKANQKLWYSKRMEEQWIYPDPGDSGLPVGAALYAYYNERGKVGDRLQSLYHGPSFENAEIKVILEDRAIDYEYHENIEQIAAAYLAKNKIIGWFQGRMEAGPRALGNRSILMNPSHPDSKDLINSKVKFREPFRPFCPSLLENKADRYLVDSRPEHFMVTSFEVKEGVKEQIPAVVHVDSTARPQMVNEAHNPRYFNLINEFGKITGHSVLLNTSFNVKGEPIVCTPREAIRCFYDNGLDVLVLGNYLVKKKGIIL